MSKLPSPANDVRDTDAKRLEFQRPCGFCPSQRGRHDFVPGSLDFLPLVEGRQLKGNPRFLRSDQRFQLRISAEKHESTARNPTQLILNSSGEELERTPRKRQEQHFHQRLQIGVRQMEGKKNHEYGRWNDERSEYWLSKHMNKSVLSMMRQRLRNVGNGRPRRSTSSIQFNF